MRCASSPRTWTQLGTLIHSWSLWISELLSAVTARSCLPFPRNSGSGKVEGLSCQRRWVQRRSKFAPVEGLVRSRPWRGEGPCSSVCPALPATALLLPARAWATLLSLLCCGRWRREPGEACTDCCPAPGRSKHPAGSPVGLGPDQNFGRVVGDAWQGCAGRLLGQAASGLEYEHCAALAEALGRWLAWGHSQGSLLEMEHCLARAVFAFAGTEREIYKAGKQKATMAERVNSNITYTHVLQICPTRNVILAQRFWECEQRRSQFVAITLNMWRSIYMGPQTEWVNKAYVFKSIQSGSVQLSAPALLLLRMIPGTICEHRQPGSGRRGAAAGPGPGRALPGATSRPPARPPRARCLPGAAAMSRTAGCGHGGSAALRAPTRRSAIAPDRTLGACLLLVFWLCCARSSAQWCRWSCGALCHLLSWWCCLSGLFLLGQHFPPWLCIPFLFCSEVFS